MAAKKKAAKKAKTAKTAKPSKKKPAARLKSRRARTFTSLAQVRAAIDAMDEKIVPLLCERLAYVTQAAQFKPSEAGVVVAARVEEVVDNARRLARRSGGRPETLELIYRALIDASTLDEQRRWRELHGKE